MRTHSPRQKLKEAQMAAREHGCFVAEKHNGNCFQYLLYRCCSPTNVFLGKSTSPDGIRRLVLKICK